MSDRNRSRKMVSALLGVVLAAGIAPASGIAAAEEIVTGGHL